MVGFIELVIALPMATDPMAFKIHYAEPTTWSLNRAGMLVYLHSEQATIVLGPRMSSLYRRSQ